MPIANRRIFQTGGWATPNIITAGLVLDLPLWRPDMAASTFNSKDANPSACTVTGATWGRQGRTFGAVNTDKISVPDAAKLDMTSGLTIEDWIYRTSGTEKFICAKRVSGSDDAYTLGTNATPVGLIAIFISGVEKTCAATTTIATNRWYHIVGTYDASNLKIYVDTVLENTVAQTGNIDTTTDNFTVGWGYDINYTWAGQIGEQRLYNRALSLNEVIHNYQVTKWRYW